MPDSVLPSGVAARAGQALDAALGRLGGGTRASRAYIFRAKHLPDGSTRYDNTHEWCAPGIEPQRDQLQDVPAEAMPWWCARMNVGLGIDADPVASLPPEAGAERELLEAQDIQRILVEPFREAAGRNGGFVGLDGVGADHPGWPPGARDTLGHAAQFAEAFFAAADEAGALRDGQTQAHRRFASLEATLPFTGGIVHDLANILGVVLLNAELLRDALVPTDENAASVEDLLSMGLRGEAMLRRLLALTRGRELPPRSLELDPFLQDLAALLHRSHQPQANVYFEGAAAETTLFLPPTHLDQIVLNLALNARDVTPEGGRVLIRSRLAAQGRVCIEVHDQGPGVPPELRERVFEAYFSTKASQGTGLGLFNVATLVRSLGGSVSVDTSAALGGACFSVVLPREQRAQTPTPRGLATLPSLLDVRVLVVDDERTLRILLRRSLVAAGALVTDCGTAEEAREHLSGSTRFDLLLTDLNLPDGDGLAIARFARAAHPEIAVLTMTGQPDSPLAEAVAAARLPLLTKPFRREALVRALDGVRPGRR